MKKKVLVRKYKIMLMITSYNEKQQ